jgi:hypothetical protein
MKEYPHKKKSIGKMAEKIPKVDVIKKCEI